MSAVVEATSDGRPGSAGIAIAPGAGPRFPAFEAGELRVYARRGDAQIRLIADGTAVPEAERIAERRFYTDRAEAEASAAACAGILGSKPSLEADAAGWHDVPAGAPVAPFLANLLRVAENGLWAGTEPAAPPTAPVELEPSPGLPKGSRTQGQKSGRPEWLDDELDLLRGLVMKGMTAKQIAPHVGRDHGAVQRKLNRLGIHLREMPRGTICFQLPFRSKLMIDGLCQKSKLTHSGLMRYWMIKSTAEPEVYGAEALKRHLSDTRV